VRKIFFLLFVTAWTHAVFATDSKKGPVADSTRNNYLNWYNASPSDTGIQGIGTEKAYQYLAGRHGEKVVVAIIDAGVDIMHEDLKGKIWTNLKEIPGNGIDDDHNGYIDDLHGWNFLGNAKGENLQHETLELTRVYKKLDQKYRGKSSTSIKGHEKKDYQRYLSSKAEYFEELAKATEQKASIENFMEKFAEYDDILKTYLGKQNYSVSDLDSIKSNSDSILKASYYISSMLRNNLSITSIKEILENNEDKIKYYLNVDYNPRSIVGDDPDNSNDSVYGNNDVAGIGNEHGTHVAGIVAACRDNGIGINGIADNVELMILRVVPDGDERDKDVANAVKYAVNNGAKIINMSFGKKYSPQKYLVDDAFKLAEKKGVLVIHAAGNESANNDNDVNYPTDLYSGVKTCANNWITVGASAMKADQNFAAFFSNYGKKTVDLFAPGMDIYSLLPKNQYGKKQGTSMACPVVTGVASMLMSYFPQLTALQVKYIIDQSVTKYNRLKVNRPDKKSDDRTVKFKKLSVSGGVVNAYNAVRLADEVVKVHK
jgi:subtilisin family serine protease